MNFFPCSIIFNFYFFHFGTQAKKFYKHSFKIVIQTDSSTFKMNFNYKNLNLTYNKAECLFICQQTQNSFSPVYHPQIYDAKVIKK